MNDDMLHAYLQHHWAGSSAGVAMFERVGRSHSDPEVAAEVRQLAAEMNEDREAQRQMIIATGATPSRIAAATGRAVELAGRFKPNGRLVRRSPLSDLFELEALRDAVAGKRAGWQLLRAATEGDVRVDPLQLDDLIRRADVQLARLEDLHLRVGRAVIRA
ncbi:hypothetical protein [Nocardioides albus]|uniref:DUF305 domain-containing protein n=1 Tax=Nocardioides albus TaxID=1841 RepID=A0A7W5F970_9ACTN|nr:hypothetical protein [Nocardioides albus]MBB3089741.1 hypothetical protein [Nocardioides albus]GGU35275.1 hypothetical protein GCM10007979_37840 [Nocardioides albus]